MQDADWSGSLSEEEFLERQAADANAAMMETLRDLFDARRHIRQHPWLSVGVAGLAGLAAGGALGRHHSTNEQSKEPVAHSTSTLSPILKTIISEALKFLIPTLFTGAVLAKTEEQINQATDSQIQTHEGGDF